MTLVLCRLRERGEPGLRDDKDKRSLEHMTELGIMDIEDYKEEPAEAAEKHRQCSALRRCIARTDALEARISLPRGHARLR